MNGKTLFLQLEIENEVFMSIKRSVRVFCFFLLTWLLLPSALADMQPQLESHG